MPDLAICVTCGTQFAETAPRRCPICDEPRQYVPETGQVWTSLEHLRATHHNRIGKQGEFEGIATEPEFGIGQRALLVPYGESNLLWDCVTLFDADTAALVERRGGLAAIAISHPHFYSAMVEWAHHFDCPIHLHRDDAEWIMRPDPAIELWDGETKALGQGLTLIRTGGHFAGATVLHSADGAGTMLMGDVCAVVPDPDYVTFLWSYPNRVPLPAADVRRIDEALSPFAYDTLHAAFWDTQKRDARRVIRRSIDRYLAALETPGGLGPGPVARE